MATKFTESKYHIIEDYIENGSQGNLEDDEIEYLDILCKMNSMRRKFGMQKTIRFYKGKPYELSAYMAKQMFYESINLFYSDDKLEKKAIRNLKAEQLEQAAELCMRTATCSKDLEIYGDLQMKAAKLRQLDKVDPPEIPQELYNKPVKIYTLDPKLIGLPDPDRRSIAKEIDALDISEKDKQRLKRDGLIENDIDIIEILTDQHEED